MLLSNGSNDDNDKDDYVTIANHAATFFVFSFSFHFFFLLQFKVSVLYLMQPLTMTLMIP